MGHPSERRPNRLLEHDCSQTGAYFITICTRDRKPLLSEIVGDDAHIVPKPYGQVAEKYLRNAKEAEKYVIMPDHIHMIIRLDEGSMWASTPIKDSSDICSCSKRNCVASIVRSIKTLTTKEIGTSIFQRSYYDHVIRNRRDYEEIWNCIEQNPIKWIENRK